LVDGLHGRRVVTMNAMGAMGAMKKTLVLDLKLRFFLRVHRDLGDKPSAV
jgi:hypothetical protein